MSLDYVANKKNLLLLIFFESLLVISFLVYTEFQLKLIVFLTFLWVIISYVLDKFHDILEYNFKSLINYLFKSFLITFIIRILLIIFANNNSFSLPLESFLLILIIFSLINIIIQLTLVFIINLNLDKRNKWLIINQKSNITNNYINKFKNFTDHFKFLFIDENEINNYLPDSNIKGIICNYEYCLDFSKKLIDKSKVEVLNSAEWFEIYLFRIPCNFVNINEIRSNLIKIKPLYLKTKRIGDLILSSLILFFSLPLFLIFGLIIFLEDRGPIIYSQNRTGYLGKTFKIYKLRTMKIDAEKDGVQWSRRGDTRITKTGSFLRRSRIDELPQLISVIKGDMSLIGPRPERPEIDEKIVNKIPNYLIRNKIKPGLSGWAQVNYPYGASLADTENKLNFDLYYLKNINFWLDLLIIAKTIRLVFNLKGALSKT